MFSGVLKKGACMVLPPQITRDEVLSLPKDVAKGWEFINPNDSFQEGYKFFVNSSSMEKHRIITALKAKQELHINRDVMKLQRTRSRSYQGCPRAAYILGIKRAAEGLGYKMVA
jgi:hypothetical protein